MNYICSLSNGNDIILNGNEWVRDIKELYNAIVSKDCTEITIKKDFVQKYFTPTSIGVFVEQLNRFNSRIRVSIDTNYAKFYDTNIKFINSINDSEDLINFVLKHKEEALKLFKMLSDNFMTPYSETLQANNKLATLHVELENVLNSLEDEKRRHMNDLEVFEDTKSKFDTLLARINYSYGKNINSDNILGIDIETSSYKKILYIKEITRVRYVDTLIHYLQEYLKLTYGYPARFVVTEPIGAYNRFELYPMCSNSLNITDRDVGRNDIFMTGFDQGIMRTVLKNPSNAAYLIVLDRSGFDKPFLRGDKVKVIYTASELSDVRAGIVESDIISYSKKTMNIPYIENFDKLTPEGRIAKYSDTEILGQIISILESR